ncbi:MAG TPA: DUF3618 domain-containing protein [Gemmatimonadales bacterium]|jgi:hypothetical protein
MTDYDRPNPDVLEDDIERSRERIAADLDQLGERLKPQHLKERAQDALEEKGRRALRRLIDMIRANPMPFAAGAGVTGLLLALGRQRTTSRRGGRRRS